MPSKNTGTKSTKRTAESRDSVDAFLAALDHPSKDVFLALRQITLAADPSISEGIKWKVPSFRTSEYFATMNLRSKDGAGVILHFGAKKRGISTTGVAIPDPDSLLVWLATDRATVTFRDLNDLTARRSSFANLIRRWIKHV